MKRKLLSLLVAATMLGCLVGCGGSDTGSEGATSGEATAEADASSGDTASGDQTLTVWCWDPTFNVYAMKQAEAMYQKDHPNFKLDIQEKVYTDIEQSLITAAEAGHFDT